MILLLTNFAMECILKNWLAQFHFHQNGSQEDEAWNPLPSFQTLHFSQQIDEKSNSQIGYLHHHPDLAVAQYHSTKWHIWLLSSHSIKDFSQKWEESPSQTLNQLSANFVVLAWEKQKNRLWIARDALGRQPVFWHQHAKGIMLSSHLKILSTAPMYSKELALEHLAEHLSFRYVHAPRTLYKDLFAVPAGHWVIVSANNIKKERWYRPSWYHSDLIHPTEKEAKLEIDYLIRRSIEPIMLSGQKTGILLSGGLDSSAILHHTSQFGLNIPSFTVVLNDENADESPFAARIARIYNSKNHLLRVSSEQLIAELQKLATQFNQPLSTAAGAIQSLLFAFSKNYVDGLFSGDGGDEVFGGRSMPQLVLRMQKSRLVNKLPYFPKKIAQEVSSRLHKPDWSVNYAQFGHDRNIGGSRVFVAGERVDLLQDPSIIRPNIRSHILTPFYQEIDSDPINDILYVWQKGWLVEDSIRRISTLSNLQDLNVHLPMLDPRLMEYVAKLPGDFKVRKQRLEFMSKWILRQTMIDRLPKRLLERPKRTILSPLSQWLRKDGRSFLAQQITEMSQKEHHLFLPAQLHTLYREHSSGQADHGLKLWTLLLFHLWYKENFQY